MTKEDMAELIHLLYVDDNPLDRELVREVLRSAPDNFKITEASSRQEFEALLAQERYDLILSDFDVLGFNHLQLLDLVQTKDPELPVVIVTGTGSEEIAVAAMKKGAADYVIKSSSQLQRLPITIQRILRQKHEAAEQRRTEQQLHFQASILQNIQDSVIMTDLAGRIVYWNEGATAIFGYTAAETLGRGILTLNLSQDTERSAAQLQKILAGQPYIGEWQSRRKDGSHFWLQVRTTVMRSAGGEAIGFIGLSKDITEQKRAEEALRQLAVQQTAILDALVSSIALIDRQGDIRVVNEAWRRFARENMLQDPNYGLGCNYLEVCEVAHEETATLALAGIQAVLAGDQAEFNLEYSCHSPDQRRWFYMTVTPFPSDEGGAVIRHLNITERKLAEEARQVVEERLRTVVNNAPIALFAIDEEGLYTLSEGKVLQSLGLRLGQIVGRSALEMYSALPGVIEETGEVVRGPDILRRVSNGEILKVHKEINERYFEIHYLPLKDEKDQVTQLTGIATEITELKQAQGELSRYATQLRGLAQASAVINASLSVPEILEVVIEQARMIIGAHQAVASLTKDKNWGQAIHHISFSDKYAAWREYDGLPDGSGIYGLVCRTNRPMRLTQAELEAHPAWRGFSWEAGKHPPLRGWLAVPLIEREAQNMGLIQLSDKYEGDFTMDDETILVQLAQVAEVAIKNARLLEAEHVAQEQLRNLTRYLHTVREDERTEIAREIHDELGQALTALKMDLTWLTKRLPDETAVQQRAAATSQLISSTIQTVQHIAAELRPGLLDDLGLVPALEWQAQQFSDRTGIECHLVVANPEASLGRERDTVIFRIFQETLTNITRHASATRVEIELEDGPEGLTLTVRDNGRGITKTQLVAPGSLGLLGMRERARDWGGKITFTGRPGLGTTVTLFLPRPGVEAAHD